MMMMMIIIIIIMAKLVFSHVCRKAVPFLVRDLGWLPCLASGKRGTFSGNSTQLYPILPNFTLLDGVKFPILPTGPRLHYSQYLADQLFSTRLIRDKRGYLSWETV